MTRDFTPKFVFLVPRSNPDIILKIANKADIPISEIGVIQSIETQRQSFPRDIKLKEFPLWIKPKRHFPRNHSTWLYRMVGDELEPTPTPPIEALNNCEVIVKDQFGSFYYNRNFFADDFGHDAHAILQDFLTAWLDSTSPEQGKKLKHARAANFSELSCSRKEPVEPTLNQIDYSMEVELRRTVERFVWNFHLNALVIVNRKTDPWMFGNYNNKTFEAILSNPFTLQSLFRIGKTGRDGLVINNLKFWKGTGKYETYELPMWVEKSIEKLDQVIEFIADDNLRTVKTRHGMPLFRSLRFRNLIEYKEPVRLSPLGRAICHLLHPDCEDPDLPNRLVEWAKLGADNSEDKMELYIKTYFCKFRRYLDHAIGSFPIDVVIERLTSEEEKLEPKTRRKRYKMRRPVKKNTAMV